MVNAKQTIVLGLFMSIASAFGNQKFYRIIFPALEVSKQEVIEFKIEPKVEQPVIKVPEFNNFLAAIGRRESSNRWMVVNRWGYMGRYQMSRKNIDKFLGKDITNRQFLESRELQNKCMIALLKHNKKILKREIRKYSNSNVNGVWITESGILAAAHLAGAGNVRRWFRNGRNTKDRLGTSLVDYMTLFSGYNLQISI